MESSNASGMQLRSNDDHLLADSVDSKQTVRNLCASQVYHKMHFFLTFTCNQAEHFGIAPIKGWLDGNKWKKYFPNYDFLSLDEQVEILRGLQQSAAVLLLRNWMEVRKMFLLYMCTSPTSPYYPVDAVFARDEYQNDAGNLPHIHMMLSLKTSEMTEDQIDKMDELVRASIVDIVRDDEVDRLVAEGILDRRTDIYEMQDLASSILSHHCNPRCLRRVSDRNGKATFLCRKPNNLKLSPDNTKHCYIPMRVKYSDECVSV